jgi:hypothetical protein
LTNPEDSIASLPDPEDLGFTKPGENVVRTDTDPPEPAPEDPLDGQFEPVTLTDDERDNFETLLTFGKKTDTKQVLGHSVLIGTLTVDEELQIGLLVKPYMNTDAYQRAYKTAVVAASVKEIDGQPLYQSLSKDEDSNFVMRKKWEKIKSYYPVAVDMMYTAVLDMEKDLWPMLEKISKKMSG